MTLSNITSGFRVTGIFPFNRDKIINHPTTISGTCSSGVSFLPLYSPARSPGSVDPDSRGSSVDVSRSRQSSESDLSQQSLDEMSGGVPGDTSSVPAICQKVCQEVCQEVCREVYQEICQEVYQEVCQEICQEMYQEICQEVYQKVCWEVCQEVYQEICQEVYQEVCREVCQEVYQMCPQ